MVPYHPPEILDGVEKRMLGDDEFIALIVTLRNKKEDRKSLAYDFKCSKYVFKLMDLNSRQSLFLGCVGK